MNGGCTKQEREDRVKKLINELGLTKCQNTIIGAPGIHKSLSGGERKRISFAAQVPNFSSSFFFFYNYLCNFKLPMLGL